MEITGIKCIDINFDFSIETGGEKPDIDRDSTTLRKYHKLLWSKKLPNGEDPILSETDNNGLKIKTDTCDIILSSDTMINTYTGNWDKNFDLRYLKTIGEIDEFIKITHKIGNFIMYPRTKDSFNQNRGTNPKIYDRFDLSLECIRRYYHNEDSPLREIIQKYNQFFQLFKNFKNYCEFYFLEDLTINNYEEISYFLPFNNFEEMPLPKNADEYRLYMNKATEFINKRNKRIQDYINNH
jgi:hypothetical protein